MLPVNSSSQSWLTMVLKDSMFSKIAKDSLATIEQVISVLLIAFPYEMKVIAPNVRLVWPAWLGTVHGSSSPGHPEWWQMTE